MVLIVLCTLVQIIPEHPPNVAVTPGKGNRTKQCSQGRGCAQQGTAAHRSLLSSAWGVSTELHHKWLLPSCSFNTAVRNKVVDASLKP